MMGAPPHSVRQAQARIESVTASSAVGGVHVAEPWK
jgi:hypothetical protein